MLDALVDAAPLIAAFSTMYLAALGHSVMEKSGILNLAIDGAFFFSTGVSIYLAVALYGLLTPLGLTYPATTVLAVLLTGLFTAVIGVFMAWVLTSLPISHGALGLSLQFLGYGLGIMAGYPVRQSVGSIEPYSLPRDPVVYGALLASSIITGVAVHFLMEKTPLGASIKACGENPHAASALGVNVLKTRLIAGALGFYILGVGASLYPLAWQRYWDIKSYTLGYGWFAFTIALAGGRNPIYLIPLSLVFGGLLEFNIRIMTMLKISADVAKLIPFLATLGVMAVYGATELRRIFAPPTSLGKPYYKEEKTV
ncbi:ABC transporter permease subunit [Desulfurococcus mucosus]|uniref:Inner-membrane translocator n=1 Tax=Desulfurococcus mucosus (strain ATCC 35584 / DSM 2162 / JCM 9187 / O7/1) TaxID=765177 RepID=E8R857_DESM0|nr:ribose ABC transporter permease [Desulfurococcus mucosus]ADV64683.1 inner-membrane translocator [Desulfurococcus mucosus DSM 2162]